MRTGIIGVRHLVVWTLWDLACLWCRTESDSLGWYFASSKHGDCQIGASWHAKTDSHILTLGTYLVEICSLRERCSQTLLNAMHGCRGMPLLACENLLDVHTF